MHLKESHEKNHNERKLENTVIVDALKDPVIIRATSALLNKSLVSRGILNESQLEEYLSILQDTHSGLKEKATRIRLQILDINNPDSPYNVIYNSYTATTRVAERVGMIAPYLADANKIIDLGTGNGRLALEFAEKQNKFVYATDLHDYRIEESKNHPNIKFVKTDRADIESGSIEGAFCSLVLHHVEERHTTSLLTSVKDALKPGSKFIILEESPPHTKTDDAKDLSNTSLDDIFREIGPQQSKKLLGVMDYISNWVANGVYDVPLPANFHTINEWQNIFRGAGFKNLSADYFGIPSLDKKFTPVPGIRFVLQK